MALLTRELELIIIARDATAATTARIAGAMTLLGVGIAALGVKWAQELGQMTSEAIEFRQGASLAFTQMFDQTGASIEKMEEMFLRVARTVPREMSEIGEAAFDIFSSIEATIPEAERILKGVGKAAVAGQTDMRSAMVPTIALMNSYNLTAEDMDFILDQQFRTVQKGILTYDDYVRNIGKVIPAAKSAGQSIETMGGTVAFLTRNGLNAAMASTSAARAFELMASPKAMDGLADLGISVKDRQGEFRDMGDIMEDIGKKFGDMTGPERKQAFKDVFGTGTIQARRFFDLAIPNWEQYQELLDDFSGPGTVGAMQRAYDVMIETPQAKLDMLRNRWQALRIELGQRFIPILVDKILPLGEKIMDWWEKLDPSQKDLAAKILAVGAALTTLVGSIVAVFAIGKLLSGVFGVQGFLGVLGALASPVGIVLGILAALAAVGYLVYKNWDKIVQFFNSKLKPAIEGVIEFFRPFVEDIAQRAMEVWDGFVSFIRDKFTRLREAFKRFMAPELFQRFKDVPKQLGELWEKAKEIVGPAVEFIKEVITSAFDVIKEVVGAVVEAIIYIWKHWGDEIAAVAEFVWDLLVTIFSGAFDIIKGIFETFTSLLKGDWEDAGEHLKEVWKALWETIVGVFGPVLQSIGDFFIMIGTWISEKWNAMWQGAKDFFIGIWTSITEFFSSTGSTISTGWTTFWNGILEFFKGIWNRAVKFLQSIWNSRIVKFFREVWGVIRELFRIWLTFLWELWKRIWDNVVNKAKAVWNAIKGFVTTVWNGIKSFFTTIWNGIRNTFVTIVGAIWALIVNRFNAARTFISTVWGAIRTFFGTIWGAIRDIFRNLIGSIWDFIVAKFNAVRTFMGNIFRGIRDTVRVIWQSIKDNLINPIADAASGIKGWIDKIVGFFSGLLDKAISYVSRIREWLSKINPASWFSPPLTYQTAKGFAEMSRTMTDQLSVMEATSKKMATNIRGNLSGLNPSGVVSSQSLFPNRNAQPAVGGLVQIINVNGAQMTNPQQTAAEIAWKIRMS